MSTLLYDIARFAGSVTINGAAVVLQDVLMAEAKAKKKGEK